VRNHSFFVALKWQTSPAKRKALLADLVCAFRKIKGMDILQDNAAEKTLLCYL